MAQSKIRLGRGLGGIFAGAKGNSPAAKKPAVGKPVAGKAVASNSKSSGHSSKTASKTSQVSSSKKPVVKVSVPAKKGTGGSHGKANVRVKTPIAAATKRPAMVQQTRRPAVQISKSKQQSNVRVSTPQSPVKGGSQNSGKPVVKQATSSAATSGRTGYAQAVETTVKSGQRFSAGHRPNVQITASANRGHMSGVVTSRPDADEKVNAAYINQLEQVLREEDHEDIAEAGRELVLEMPHEAVDLEEGEAVSDDYLSEEEIESADQEDSDEYGVTNLAMDSDVDHAGEVDVVADELATQNEGATAYFGVENIVQEASDVEDEEAMLGEDEFSGNSSGDVGFARSATDGSQASQFVSHTGQARGGQYEGSVRREVMPVSFSVGGFKDFAEVSN
jgi:hypothetical protein